MALSEQEYKRAWYQRNKERISQERKHKYAEWRRNNPIKPRKKRKTKEVIHEGSLRRSRKFHSLRPEYARFQHLKQRYGLTPEQYEVLRTVQGKCCYICGKHETRIPRKRLFVDHDHSSGRIRKLLCDPCNRLLADARENIVILQKAIAYLQEHVV